MEYAINTSKQINTPKNQWYAIYTRPRWEKKTSGLLVKKNIETYCPLKTVKKQWADRKKIVLEPLFTSYVFIYTNEASHLAIKQTDGVINFVHWLGKPAIIKDIEIENIKKFLYEYKEVNVKAVEVTNNDIVRITKGSLTQKEGKVIEVKNNIVKLLLPSMGFVMEAYVEKENLEVISKL